MPSQMRLLLIDDEVEYAKTVLLALEGTQLMCRHCTVDQFRPEMIDRHNVHMVLLHAGVLEVGSAAICPTVRLANRVPITILSQRTRREDLFHFLNQGADDLIAMRDLDRPLMLIKILTLLRRVYEYSRPISEALQPESIGAQIPTEWLQCESCSYMGPPHRFDRQDATGQRCMMCPNCNRAQNLRYQVG